MMKLNKRQAYLALLATCIILCLLYQSIWIFSRTTTAEIYAWGRTNFRRSSGITWMKATYTVDGQTYHDAYLKDDRAVRDRYFEIRYLSFDPGTSRSNTFLSNWGPLLMIFTFVALVCSIAFIRKDIIADQAVFVIQGKRPLIRIEGNQIEEYDEHDIGNKTPTEAEEDLKKRIGTETDLFQKSDVATSVYKFNPNAIGIFIFYFFYFLWFFYSFLTKSIGNPEIFFFGVLLVFVPLYVQNTNNPTFKAKIPDQGSLVFSTAGVQNKDEFYPLEDIEAAVVYLEDFRGFKYTERVTIGNARTTASGDNNKISFRYKGQVFDFIFILDDAADYWSFKNLMADWSVKGINVFLKKAFEDDFIIQEMVKFNTPVSVRVFEGEEPSPEGLETRQ